MKTAFSPHKRTRNIIRPQQKLPEEHALKTENQEQIGSSTQRGNDSFNIGLSELNR